VGASDRTDGQADTGTPTPGAPTTGTTTPRAGAGYAKPGGDPVDNPVVNSPYDPPGHHFELGPDGTPTGVVLDGRRRSESFVPVPPQRKRAGTQAALDLDATGERREVNELINAVRDQVDLWRGRGYPGVTPYTRKLLHYWAARPPEREELLHRRPGPVQAPEDRPQGRDRPRGVGEPLLHRLAPVPPARRRRHRREGDRRLRRRGHEGLRPRRRGLSRAPRSAPPLRNPG